MTRPKRIKEYCVATVIALYAMYRYKGLWATMKESVNISVFIVTAMIWKNDGIVAKKEWIKRMRVCLKCPLYNYKFKTCGTYGILDYDGKQMGCLCYMPFKNTFSESICWLEL